MRSLLFPLVASCLALVAPACGGETSQDPGTGRDAGADTSAPETGAPETGAPETGAPDTGTPDAATPDASPDSGPDAGSFSVKNVTGLALWLDATKGVTADGNGNVSQWADQSGNANDAVQVTLGLQPTLVAASIDGKPSIHFTTNPANSPFAHLTVPDATALRLGAGDFYITCVVKWSNANNGPLGLIFSKQSLNAPFAGYALYMNFTTPGHAGGQLDANTNVASTVGSLNDGLARQYGFVRTSNTASIRVNGASSGTLASTSVNSDAVGEPLSLGGRATNGLHPLVGDIAELVIVKGAISGSDIAAIEGYLQAKYAL